jgi:hypothetical protein
VHRKALLIVAVCVIALTVITLLDWDTLFPRIPRKYERNIARNFSTQEEERATITAESLNYSAIVNSTRFRGSSDPEAYLHTGTYLEYTSANFIDSEAVSYYETRYNSLQGKEYPKQIELNYMTNATRQSKFRIYNSPAPANVSWHNNTVVLLASDGSVKREGSLELFFKNQSNYQKFEWDYDFSFSNCYVVEMKLQYSEVYASLAAYFLEVNQIVILDQNFDLLLLGFKSGTAVA